MSRIKEQWMEMQQEWEDQRLASTLGISYEELGYLEWDVREVRSDDGLLYNYVIEFYDGSDKSILQKVKNLEDGCRVILDPWEFEDGTDEAELEWEIRHSDQLTIFNSQLEAVETLLGIDLDQQTEFSFLVMLHAHIIASVEQYLSSIFIHKVTNSDLLTRKLIETDPLLGKRTFTLKEIYIQHEKIKVNVASYLKSLIFHRLKIIRPMYKNVFGYEFSDISWLTNAILIRHDCAHRAGYDKEGKKIVITHQDIQELAGRCKKLVSDIDSHFNELKI